MLSSFFWYNFLEARSFKEIQFNIFKSLLERWACCIIVWTFAQCMIFSYNFLLLGIYIFPHLEWFFFWYHKVLITIWIGIFACKHLLSSNNFSQAKVMQYEVKFMNSGPLSLQKLWHFLKDSLLVFLTPIYIVYLVTVLSLTSSLV